MNKMQKSQAMMENKNKIERIRIKQVYDKNA